MVSVNNYLSYGKVLVLSLLLCNHDNLILKLLQKNIATLMKGSFLYVVSKLEVLRMINKELLAQVVYKSA